MLPSTNRLKKGDFKDKANLKRLSSRLFSIVLNKKKSQVSRYAVVVGGKVTNNKPKRNRLKRRIYSAISKFDYKDNLGFDFIIYPNKEALEAKHLEIQADISKLLSNSLQKSR